MKRDLKYFIAVWAIGFVLFNAVTFLIPNTVFGVTRFDKGVFWVAYALVLTAFALQLITACKFVKAKDKESAFLSLSLLRIGYVAIIVSTIIGSVFTVFPVLPAWVGGVVSVLTTGIFMLNAINANVASAEVKRVGKNVKTNTEFMKNAVIEAANIITCATTDEIRYEAQKVYDALRYSDYVSSTLLVEKEREIMVGLKALRLAVTNANMTETSKAVSVALVLIQERNILAKGNK